jgi:hypothetical protein
MFKNFYTASPNAMKTKLMHLSSSRAFQRDQECNLKHPSSVDLISTNKTKQNKLPCFIESHDNYTCSDEFSES